MRQRSKGRRNGLLWSRARAVALALAAVLPALHQMAALHGLQGPLPEGNSVAPEKAPPPCAQPVGAGDGAAP